MKTAMNQELRNQGNAISAHPAVWEIINLVKKGRQNCSRSHIFSLAIQVLAEQYAPYNPKIRACLEEVYAARGKIQYSPKEESLLHSEG
jgi:hypothetical protein